MRRALYVAHLWSGLLVGLLIAVLGVSGSLLVFRADIERWQTREWRQVAPSGTALPLDTLVARAQAGWPARELSKLFLPGAPDESLQVFLQKPRPRTLKEADLITVFVNPYNGEALGHRRTADGWLWWLQDLHYALFAGELGLKVNGVAAAVLVALSLTGPLLWWPGWRRRARAYRIRARPIAARWRDLHAVVGVAACAVLAFTAATALYFAFRDTATATVTLFTGNGALVAPRVDPGPRAPLAKVVEAARAAEPTARFDELRAGRRPGSAVSISYRLPGDFVVGRHRLFLDPLTATVLRDDRFDELPAGAGVLGNMAPWHFGSFGGRATQWLWFVAGFVPAFLFCMGIWLWSRSRGRHATPASVSCDQRRTIPSAADDSTMPGASSRVRRSCRAR